MKIGHLYLVTASGDSISHFVKLIESLDRLAIDQHALVASKSLARRLHSCPYVTVGPVVKSPVMAYCLMPPVDLVHIHDGKSGQVGLLLTLTRSTPFVMTESDDVVNGRSTLRRSIMHRAQAVVPQAISDPEEIIRIYRRTVDAWSELPQNANCG